MSNLVFIPGIKGSQLYEGVHKRWYPSTVDDISALAMDNELQPGLAISQVTHPIRLKKIKIYRGIMDKFQGCLQVFTYDWRKSIFDHLSDLDEFLKGEEGPITIIAHSMGGVLLKAYLLEGASPENKSKIEKIITLGTPWLGSPFAYRALLFGELMLTEKDFLHKVFYTKRDEMAKLLAQNYPSVYELLPSREYYEKEGGKFLLKTDRTEATFDEIIDSLTPHQQQYFYSNAQKVHNLMSQPLDVEHHALIGYGYATLRSVVTNNSQRTFYKQNSKFFNGDFTVPLISAQVPHEAYEYYVKGQHVNLCSLSPSLNWIDWVLNGAVEGTLPSGITTDKPDLYTFPVSAKAYIMCPVGFTVTDKDGNSVAGDLDPEQVDVDKLQDFSDEEFYSHTVGDAKYLFFNDTMQEHEVKITAYDTGIANVAVISPDDDSDEETVIFESVPVDPKTVLQLKLSNPETRDPLLTVSTEEVKDKPVKKSKITKQDSPEPREIELIIDFSPVEGTSKSGRKHHIYTGDIALNISGDTDKTLEIFWVLNDEKPVKYEEPVKISAPDGQNLITIFSKDLWGNSQEPYYYNFQVDRNPPTTVPVIIFNPDGGVKVGLKALSEAGHQVSKYRWVNSEGEGEWHTTIPAGLTFETLESVFGDSGIATLEYYSIDKFKREEKSKSITLNVKYIENELWNEQATTTSALRIWNELFQDPPKDIEAFVKQKTFTEIAVDELIPNNVSVVRLQTPTVEVIIEFLEQYTLYWSGPPREVVSRGKSYEFSFQLLTDNKLAVVDTEPVVRYFPYVAYSRGTGGRTVQIAVNNDGVFKGSFVIDEYFPADKVKLVVTDVKHKTPPLRETILMVED